MQLVLYPFPFCICSTSTPDVDKRYKENTIKLNVLKYDKYFTNRHFIVIYRECVIHMKYCHKGLSYRNFTK